VENHIEITQKDVEAAVQKFSTVVKAVNKFKNKLVKKPESANPTGSAPGSPKLGGK
jgi:hypothetical protein